MQLFCIYHIFEENISSLPQISIDFNQKRCLISLYCSCHHFLKIRQTAQLCGEANYNPLKKMPEPNASLMYGCKTSSRYLLAGMEFPVNPCKDIHMPLGWYLSTPRCQYSNDDIPWCLLKLHDFLFLRLPDINTSSVHTECLHVMKRYTNWLLLIIALTFSDPVLKKIS